ncbi:hypothetical protein NEDG_01569 [Nematocida displodere]|uniref:Uncharacterized protein n=1 Tax=Nematocida displodere TaxID=1805483 RepID=A0A177EHH2_9MICR|nr:hypothetical protein NEDG_01569 [Nematocida displodere]
MHIWNRVCSLAKKKSISVKKVLWISVCRLNELDAGSVCPGVKLLSLEENTEGPTSYNTFFELGMKWALSGGEETQKIKSIWVSSTEALLNTNKKQKYKDMVKLVSESKKWLPIFQQRKLYIYGRLVLIPRAGIYPNQFEWHTSRDRPWG